MITKDMDKELSRKIFINKIMISRLKKGVTQAQLAEKIGTSKSNISRIESGEQNITVDMFLKICKALDQDLSVVMEDAKPYTAENFDYSLKIYDTELLRFSLAKGYGLLASITYVNPDTKHLLPLDLELTEDGLLTWLRKRVVPKNRAYVGDIMRALGLNLGNLKAIIDVCKGLSINDSYWVVPQNFNGSFYTYNLYENEFSELLALIAYMGGPYSIKDFSTSPEFTTGGMLRKAWRLKRNGIWLYKGGTEDFANAGNEPYSEFYACQVAEKMQLKSVHYVLENWKGILSSKCKLFTDINTAYVPIGKIVRHGGIEACIDFYRSLGDEYFQDLASMLVFDAVVYNTDRHFGNFGLLRDNKTGEFKGTAPVFDNGCSLFCYAMKQDFEDLPNYIKTLSNPYGYSFDEVCSMVIGKKQKAQLRKLINFKFEESDVANLPSWRVHAIEDVIQQRVHHLLEL